MKAKFLSEIRNIKRVIQSKPDKVETYQEISDERYRRILLTGGTSAIVKGVSAIINLFIIPLTVKYLGSERYGLWMAISSMLALMSFADLGLGNGLVNAVAKASGRKNQEEASVAISSTFFLLLVISLILFIFFILIYPYISWDRIFNVKSSIAVIESGPTMFILVAALLLNMPLGVIQRVQEGFQEGYRFQLWQLVGSFISLFLILTCIFFKGSLPLLVLSLSSGQIISTIINGYFLFNNHRPNLKPSYRQFNLKVGKNLIKSGLIFLTLGIFTLIANASDDLVIAQKLGASYVSGYEIVKKLFLFSMFTQFIIQPLWPAFAESLESGDIIWIRKTLKKSLFISITFGLVFSLPLLLGGKQIIQFWVGAEYIPTWSLLIGFYCFIVLANYGGVMSTFLNSGDLIGKQTIFIGLASITALLTKIYLSAKIGVSGVIWATVICYSIFYVLPSYRLAFNYIKIQNDEKGLG